MPLDPVLRDALNKQITNERYNAAVYLACALRFEYLNLPGFAHWMKHAAKEETQHAKWFAEYLIDRYESPLIAPLDGFTPPQATIENAGSLFFLVALTAEQRTTQAINALYLLSDEVNDPQTCVFLHWFIAEQTRSEREVSELLAQIKFAEGCPAGVLAMDERLGKDG